MYNFLTKHGQTFAFALGTIVTLVFLGTAVAGINADGLAGQDLTVMKDKFAGMTYFDSGLWLTATLLLICVGLLAAFLVWDIFKFPKQMIKALVAFAGIIIIFYILKSVVVAETGTIWNRFNTAEFGNVDDGTSRAISAGLWVTVILIASAVGIMVISEIRNFFK